jgi:hypothetical protein
MMLAAPPVSGPVLFARYAYGPNRLGYCGPDDHGELLEQATAGHGREDDALRSLAGQFDGAYPYLQLIARANGLADPLDPRVVEAYWLGNDLLSRVTPGLLGESMEMRFRRRLRSDGWRWLAEKPAAGALPMHAFHVLDVFPRMGLMRGGVVDRALEVMDSCRIRWGRVVSRDGDSLVVSAVPLALVDGKLALAPARIEKISAWRDGLSFIESARPGDVVSIHWDWACDTLDQRRLAALQGWTAHELAIANLTI